MTRMSVTANDQAYDDFDIQTIDVNVKVTVSDSQGKVPAGKKSIRSSKW